MSLRDPRSHEVLVGVLFVFGGAVEVAAEGALVVVGFAALGAALGAWAVVYDHVLCRGEPFDRDLVISWVVGGAVAVPGLAALQLVFGTAVWVAVLVTFLLAWAVATSLRVDSIHREPGGR